MQLIDADISSTQFYGIFAFLSLHKNIKLDNHLL